MKKDQSGIRDYAVKCFERWACLGSPTAKEYEEQIREKVRQEMTGSDPEEVLLACESAVNRQKTIILDILAIERLFATLEEQGRGEYAEAVRAVYCHKVTYRNDITYRALSFARNHYVDNMTVFKWLKVSLVLWGKYRGLTVMEDYDHGTGRKKE